jgi:hypothetical protein
MIYELNTNQPVSVPEWAEQELREIFPSFFKGTPIKIKALANKMKQVQKVSSMDRDGSGRILVQPPSPRAMRSSGYYYDPEYGDQVFLQYSESAPRMTKDGVKFNYPAGTLTIKSGMTIKPTQKDLLFYLHYLCPIIKDNKCVYAKDPIFEYDKPQEEAANKINVARAARELENLIYFDTPYEKVIKAINGLGIKVKATEEENRVALHDAIKRGNDVFKKNAFEILGPSEKKQEVKSEETIHELINRLSSEGFIKNEDGIWYLRDRRGDGSKWLKNPFFESNTSKDAFALIDHLKVNEELLGKLRKL